LQANILGRASLYFKGPQLLKQIKWPKIHGYEDYKDYNFETPPFMVPEGLFWNNIHIQPSKRLKRNFWYLFKVVKKTLFKAIAMEYTLYREEIEPNSIQNKDSLGFIANEQR
jgi:hypothetical protein